MVSVEQARAFEARAVRRPDSNALYSSAKLANSGDAESLIAIAAALLHCAFAAPETAMAVYAALRNGWLGRTDVPVMPQTHAAPLSSEFWNAFWQFHADRDAGSMDAFTVTSRIAGLAAFADPSLRERAETIAASHPKAAEPATRQPPPRLTLDELASQPEGSLARDFWRQIVDNKFDLEVLDRESINLASLPPALCYLNTRILQMHDIWHLVGGFHLTALHEIAISAFQQAQFGHGYSAMFLAVVVSGAALRGSGGETSAILQTIAEASQYGWDSPSFMAIPWEEEWHMPLQAVRARHGIVGFEGSVPSDLFERMLALA